MLPSSTFNPPQTGVDCIAAMKPTTEAATAIMTARWMTKRPFRALVVACTLVLYAHSLYSEAFTTSPLFQSNRCSATHRTDGGTRQWQRSLSSRLASGVTMSSDTRRPGGAIFARVTNAWRSAQGEVRRVDFGQRNHEDKGGALRAFSGGSGPPRSRGMGGWGWGAGGGGGGGGDGDGDEQGLSLVGRNDLGALGYAQALAMVNRSMRYRSYGGRRRGSRYGRQSYRRARRPRNDGITVTKVLTAINVLMYVMQMRYPSVTTAGWKMTSAITQKGQWYRLITPVVLHGSVSHLLINSLSLNSVGPLVEQLMGKAKFLSVYVLAGVSGNALSCIVNPRMPAVGASGSIFGVVGAFGAFCLMNQSVLGRENADRALRGVGQTLALNLMLGMSSTQIDNMGHMGGFIGGSIATLLIGPRLRRRTNPVTGELYTVDVSPSFAFPRLGKRADTTDRRWP